MRCAVYVRVSTDMTSQKSSIAHQKNFFEKYIEDKGWELYKIYQDIESGMSIAKRKGLKQLIDDGNEGKFEVVFTKSISRFARNTLEGLKYIREFKKSNIRFITIEDAFDSEEYDEFMFTLLLSLAQKESEKISERVRFGKYQRAKKGYYNGSNPPYGYKKKGNGLEPANDISTEVTSLIFKMYLGGNGLYKIAHELNNKGYPTPSQVLSKANSSNTWHQSTIKNILTNEVYVGNLVQNKTRTKDVLDGTREENHPWEYVEAEHTHQGIISSVIFNEVQELMRKKSISRSGNNKNLFSNILYCGECLSTMHFKRDKAAYICGKLNKMGKKYCKGAYISEGDLKSLIKTELKEQVKSKVNLATLNNRLKLNLYNNPNNKGLDLINKELQRLYKKRERLYDILIDGLISKEVFEGRKVSLNNQLELLQSKKNKLELDISKKYRKEFEQVDELIQFIDLNNVTLNKLIKRIEVYKDGRVAIYFNFSDI